MSVIRISFLLFFLPLFSYSQNLILESNPSSVRWYQVNTPGFRIIYPLGFDSEAQRMANTLQYLHEAESETMGGNPPKKISIVLQTKNAISNGFVTLGPRRSEFQTMPPQDYNFLNTNKWLDMLAVHEFRHVVQYQHSKTGWNKLFYYLFGENTQAGMAYAAAPPWFYEGDAVVIESALTPGGRGRMPSFNRVFKANMLEGKRFNYNKQHLRSYKDFIPNHYVLGYNFVGHLRRRTSDPKILAKVTHRAFGWPFIPFTFSNSLKKETGEYLVPNYELMMAELDSLWKGQLDGLKITDFERVNQRDFRIFTNYQYPQALDNGRVIALKSGIGDIQQFVSIDTEGNEHHEFTPGIYNDAGMLSTSGQRLIWNEYTFDPRWRPQTYSVIKSYDFSNGKERTITHKSRYSAAALSPKGNKIVTILNTEDNDNFVVIIDYKNGQELKRFANPGNNFYAMPSWSPNGTTIVALKITDQGKSVVALNSESGEENILIAESRENIGHPVIFDNYLLYNSPYSGIDNIYARDLGTGDAYQVTSSKYGAYNPSLSPDRQWLYYNDYTVDGLDIVKIPFDPSGWKPMAQVEDRNLKYNELLEEQEGKEDILQAIPDKEYPVRHYSKVGHAINIHSWGPFASTDLNRVQLGVFSRDVLSTTDLSVGYTYDIAEETGFASASISYQGVFPIIDFEVQKGSRSSDRGIINDERFDFEWKELSAEGGIRLPLLLTNSKYHSQLTLGNAWKLTKVSNFENPVLEDSRLAPINDSLAFFFKDEITNGELLSNKANISFFRLLKQSQQDLYSEWGQSVAIEHFSTPYGGDFTGSLLAIRANLYFPSPIELFAPGIFKHHSFYLQFGYQNRKDDVSTDLYYFRNRIFKPRGFSYPDHEKFTSLSFNYSFPLWYPDIAFGPFFYFKRIRINGFYDVGKGKGQNYFVEYEATPSRLFISTIDESYRSIGGELIVDFNAFRFPPEISLGLRYSYLLTTKETNLEFLVVNIAF